MSASGIYDTAFYARLRDGVRRSAEVIVPLVLQLVGANSVVDVGCGEGDWLTAFQSRGVEDIFGIDGEYIDRATLQIPAENFRAADLSRPIAFDRKFDLAISLEVAEHLPPECAANFVEGLTRLAPVVLFSAAIPFQAGTNHLNLQWPEYWADLFEKSGFVTLDAIRKHVWHDDRVEWWYAQNALVFVQRGLLDGSEKLAAEFCQTDRNQLALVHPRQYESLHSDYERALSREAYLRQHPATGVRQAITILRDCVRNSLRARLGALGDRGPIWTAKVKS